MILLPMLLASLGCVMTFELTPLYEWKYFEYQWDSESGKEQAIATGLYDYKNVNLYDAEWRKDGKLFVTTPRLHHVNPASLSTVFEEPGDERRALLQPYPSQEWHIVGNCSGITNVLKFVIDKCDNMWIVDSGTIGDEVICPAQILKFDVNTDELLMRYKIPEEVSQKGLFSTNAVRTEGPNCEEMMLFAGDLRGSGYLIFDGSTSWRLDNDIFKPDTKLVNLAAGDKTVEISYGPFGFLDVDKKYAHAEFGVMWSLSGSHAYALSMQDLSNSRDSQENLQWYMSDYELPSRATAAVISKQGILFTAFIERPKLNCVWLGNPVTSKNIDVLIEDSEPDSPPLITSMRTATDDDGNEYLLFTKNNYVRFRAGMTNFGQSNAGVYFAKIADLTNGTRCQPDAHPISVKGWEEIAFTPVKIPNDSNF